MNLLLLQMSIVLIVTVGCGWIARQLGQARVIGEIIGGILIGPSVFGRFAPHLSASLFPVSSFAPLETLSTVGLVLFLFMVGMELDYGQLYRQRATAVAASGMSILLPFAMGALLAHSLRIRFAPQGIGSIPFVLFLGIAEKTGTHLYENTGHSCHNATCVPQLMLPFSDRRVNLDA